MNVCERVYQTHREELNKISVGHLVKSFQYDNREIFDRIIFIKAVIVKKRTFVWLPVTISHFLQCTSVLFHFLFSILRGTIIFLKLRF